MRVALRRPAPARGRVATGRSIPAPVGGLDLISPLAAMKPEYAIALDNMFCQPGYCELRRDRIMHASVGLALTPIESVMAYHGPTTLTDALFAAAGTSIFDVTIGGNVAAASVTGVANARWQHVNFSTSGGNFLWICNGADTPRYYNGTVWGSVAITGIAPSSIVQVAAHHNRLWFVLKDTTNAAYLPVDSIQGAASSFPLGALFTKGGFLQAIATWSRDAGDGPDDMICFASSRGQVAVYRGTDPSSATTFALVGVFDTAPPIGRRCFTKVGADLAMVTIDGVLPLSRALVTDRAANLRISLTQRIQPAVAGYGKTNAGSFGWQLVSYPRGPAAILNVPTTENSVAIQYVMNTVTGAWSRYTGWNANAFEVFKDRLFFGGNDGCVYEADKGGLGANSSIAVDMRTAFNYFGSRGRLKQFKALRGIPGGDGRVQPKFALNVDFRDDAPLAAVALPISTGAVWDSALWDAATWGAEARISTNWLTTNAQGSCASLRMAFTLERPATSGNLWDELFWDEGYWDDANDPDIVFQASAFDLLFEPGSIM